MISRKLRSTKEEFWGNGDELVERMEQIDEQTRDFIRKFFSDKEFFCGGSIPDRLMVSQENVELVEETSFADGAQLFHNNIDNAFSANDNFDLKINPLKMPGISVLNAARDLLLKIIEDMFHKGIPKPRTGGLLVLYLELVEGVKISTLTPTEV